MAEMSTYLRSLDADHRLRRAINRVIARRLSGANGGGSSLPNIDYCDVHHYPKLTLTSMSIRQSA
jgi:hypothetical protein